MQHGKQQGKNEQINNGEIQRSGKNKPYYKTARSEKEEEGERENKNNCKVSKKQYKCTKYNTSK
jgi:hypothetical protein